MTSALTLRDPATVRDLCAANEGHAPWVRFLRSRPAGRTAFIIVVLPWGGSSIPHYFRDGTSRTTALVGKGTSETGSPFSLPASCSLRGTSDLMPGIRHVGFLPRRAAPIRSSTAYTHVGRCWTVSGNRRARRPASWSTARRRSFAISCGKWISLGDLVRGD
jgi:hypothetical protein